MLVVAHLAFRVDNEQLLLTWYLVGGHVPNSNVSAIFLSITRDVSLHLTHAVFHTGMRTGQTIFLPRSAMLPGAIICIDFSSGKEEREKKKGCRKDAVPPWLAAAASRKATNQETRKRKKPERER